MQKKGITRQWIIALCIIILAIFSYNSCSDLYSSIKSLKEIFALKFDANGGVGAIEQIDATQDSIIVLPQNGFTRVGYNFLGWNSKKDGTGDLFQEKTKFTVLKSTTFYASWSSDNYAISYHLNGGANHADNPEGYTIESNEITLENPSRTGFTFAGWFANEDFSGDVVTSIPKGSTGAKTFYAKWSTDGYSISYHLNGGTNHADNPEGYTIESGAINLAAPSKDGYVFVGWYDNTEFTGTAINTISENSTGDKTFWAKWSTDGYSITYHLNGGINHVANFASYTIETATINLQNPSKTGYSFAGWYDNAGFTGTAVTSIPQGSTENKTFYAKWTANNYTVSFNANDGAGTMTAQTIVYGTSANLKANSFTREGYTFDGWLRVQVAM